MNLFNTISRGHIDSIYSLIKPQSWHNKRKFRQLNRFIWSTFIIAPGQNKLSIRGAVPRLRITLRLFC